MGSGRGPTGSTALPRHHSPHHHQGHLHGVGKFTFGSVYSR